MAVIDYANFDTMKAFWKNIMSKFALKTQIPTKISELENDSGFTAVTIDSDLSSSSTNPVQNKVVNSALNNKVPITRTVNGKDLSGNIILSASDVGADVSGTATSAVSTHNTNAEAHNDIRLLIEGLTIRLNALANSDDTTLDQMAEVVAYIKSNRTLIESITTDKVNVSDIINNLTTNVSNKPLSAAQGVAIKSLIDALQAEVDSHTTNKSNPHGVTKAQIGLGDVENKSSATIRGEITSSNVTTALGFTPSKDGHTHNYAGSSEAGGAATSTVKLATPRKITLGQQLQGSAQFDGSGDITINAQLKHCRARATIDVTESNQWHKVASTTLTSNWAQHIISFQVYNAQNSVQYGILTFRVTSNGTAEFNNATLKWDYASSSINPSQFVCTCFPTDGGFTAELWCQHTAKNNVYHFTVLHEGISVRDAEVFELYDTEDGVASYTAGDNVTIIESIIPNIKNSIDGNASTATALTTSAGSATQPVYFKDGKPVATTYALDTPVKSIGYGAIKTEAGVADKVVDVSANTNWTLKDGSIIGVWSTVTNTAQNPTLNVNGTGAKPIFYGNDTVKTSNLWAAGEAYTVTFYMWHGNAYIWMGHSRDNNTTYSIASESSNGLISKEDKTKLNYTNLSYGSCSTAAGTAAKVVSVTAQNWALKAGSTVVVKFSETNTASNPTLNVNGTGAKPIWYNTGLITTSNLSYAGYANRYITFVYDGTQYVFQGWSTDVNTTTSNAGMGQGYGTCSTAEATTAKVVTLSSYTLSTGGIVAVKFTNAVPASATMNINGKGAKAIYYKGAAITAGVIKAGDTATFIYNGTQYHLLTVDRDNNTTYSVATTSANGLMSSFDKSKLDGIATGANKTVVDTAMSTTSTNPVQNKVVKAALDGHTHGLRDTSLVANLANTTEDSGWSMLSAGYSKTDGNTGHFLKSVRTQANAPAWTIGDYAAGVAFGGADTKGIITHRYSSPEIKFAGGNGDKPVWNMSLRGASGVTYNLADMQSKITSLETKVKALEDLINNNTFLLANNP